MDLCVGQIVLFAGNYAPQNFLVCNGSLMQVSQYAELFAILGTTYGGDGRTTFALPKLEPLNNAIYIICMTGLFPTPN